MKKKEKELDVEQRLRLLANLLIDRFLEDKKNGRLSKFIEKEIK